MNIAIREATTNDTQLLFEWANESVTRQNSFNPNPIDWNSHVVWFNKKLKDTNCKIYIFQINDDPIGVVRFETGINTIIGITVAPNKRGMGLGSIILKKACNKFSTISNQNILAYIKKDNVSSQKAFEKAGFAFYKEAFYNDIACIILILRIL